MYRVSDLDLASRLSFFLWSTIPDAALLDRLTQVEAARIAAALPSPKKRSVVDPSGFTRRHGNVIAARSGVVKSSELDSCVYD